LHGRESADPIRVSVARVEADTSGNAMWKIAITLCSDCLQTSQAERGGIVLAGQFRAGQFRPGG
jgi:hypothetical protein